MKKFLLVFTIFAMLQPAIAQKKKKIVTKPPVVEKVVEKVVVKPSVQKTASKKSSKAEGLSKDDFLFNAGIGTSSFGLPIYVGADYFVDDDISVGAQVSYQTFKETFFGSNYKSTIIGIGANGNYHFGRILESKKEWDFYAGLGLGYYIWSFDNTNYVGANSSGIGLGGQLGARYFVSKNFAINAELGGATTTSGAKIGISVKF